MRAVGIRHLIVLFHHRWAVPILVEVYRTSGSKFVTLVKRLGASRDSVRRTLTALIEQNWVIFQSTISKIIRIILLMKIGLWFQVVLHRSSQEIVWITLNFRHGAQELVYRQKLPVSF